MVHEARLKIKKMVAIMLGDDECQWASDVVMGSRAPPVMLSARYHR